MNCNPTTEIREKRNREISKIYDHWLSKSEIFESFRTPRGFDQEMSKEYFRKFAEDKLEIPFNADSPITKENFLRLKTEIDWLNRRMKGGFMNSAFVVPEGISKQHPVARRFYNNLNEILNYERTQVNKVINSNKIVADHMLDAYESQFGKTGKAGYFRNDKSLTEFRKIREAMSDPNHSPDTRNEFIKRLDGFLETNEGRNLKEFMSLVELDNKAFDKKIVEGYKNKEGGSEAFNTHVIQAVKQARKNLSDMGAVYINGLGTLKKILAMRVSNTEDFSQITDKRLRSLFDRIDNARKDIQLKREKGGYYPHLAFETMMQVRDRLNKAMNSEMKNQSTEWSNVVEEIYNSIDTQAHADRIKKRNPYIHQFYEKDPLLVLKEYGEQSTQFNKLLNTQLTYLRAMKGIPNGGSEFIKGMKNFIDEEYAVFTRGTSERGDFWNNAVTTLNSIQTARTMGLNITGAVKNAASAINYYSRIGYSEIGKTKEAMNRESFKNVMTRVEKEAGFLFTDAAKELYSEGLITKEQFNSNKVEFDPMTGKITIDKEPIRNFLKGVAGTTLEGLLYFHRVTENSQRKWMFRSAFHKKYDFLIKNGYSESKAENFAKNFALKMVNGWAYEYSAHAKAKAVRGEWRTIDKMENEGYISKKLNNALGAGSEVAFHLLHYPMSLFESQWSALKGATKGVISGEGRKADELAYAMRYAGFLSVFGSVSMLTNTNLFNIFENETYERLKRMRDDLYEHSNPDKGTFGLLGQFTGPTVSMINYFAKVQNIIDTENSVIQKILFGNVNFANPDDKLTELYSAYQYSTAYGTVKNKLLPALRSGRGMDLFRHWFKAYPSEWTKKGSKKVWGEKPKKEKAIKTNLDASLSLLRSMSA